MVFEDIIEDLLQNKFVLVVSENLTYIELKAKLKEVYEDVVLLNLVFCEDLTQETLDTINNGDRFDSVYHI